MVLVVRRELLDGIGSFQGLSYEVGRYLPEFLKRENNFFVARSRAEDDPTLKQIIPYVVFTHEGKILRYLRGAKSGEKRLVSKASIGIGGHINDGDEGLFSFDEDAYRAAVRREITEELRLGGGFGERMVGLINDDATEVGKVHLGVVHLCELENPAVEPGEAAIRELKFLSPDQLRAERDGLESWSAIVLDQWERLTSS